jgi:hypothetical protein
MVSSLVVVTLGAVAEELNPVLVDEVWMGALGSTPL